MIAFRVNVEAARAIPIEGELARRKVELTRRKNWLAGPCPKCGGTDRFSVNLAKQLFYCRGCVRGGDVIALVSFLDGADFLTACRTLTGALPPADATIDQDRQSRLNAEAAERDRIIAAETANNQRLAGEIWREAVPIPDTLATVHFAYRGILGPALAVDTGALRFHPRCWDRAEQRPAIIELLVEIHGNQPRAIRRTFLTAQGQKIGKAKVLGPKSGTAAKLSADADVTHHLTIGEGLETALAGMMLGYAPTWAVGDAGELAKFPVLGGAESLTILVDHDKSGRGQRAAIDCSARWTAAGREVFRLVPRQAGADVNNLLTTKLGATP